MKALRSFFRDVWTGLRSEPMYLLVALGVICVVALEFSIWLPA